jgi:hypothetical protein
VAEIEPMTKDEMRLVLADHLAKFRTWSYAQRVSEHGGFLEHAEGVGADGTTYQMEFNATWDDKPNGDIRVIADLSAEPQKPLLGFLPVYVSDVNDGFIMSPDGSIVAEAETER